MISSCWDSRRHGAPFCDIVLVPACSKIVEAAISQRGHVQRDHQYSYCGSHQFSYSLASGGEMLAFSPIVLVRQGPYGAKVWIA